MFGYDYCFCDYRDCPRTDCKRHHEWMPVGVPVSISDFREYRDENGECEYFWQGHPEQERLNLNTLSAEELTLIGLSKNKAALIVAAREARGGFRSVADLRGVRSIGKGTYEKVCNLLYVEEQPKVVVLDEQQKAWMLRISDATEWMCDFLNKTFPGTWCKLRFEHVDAAAYWFSFELTMDSRRQTWCVRHSDLEG